MGLAGLALCVLVTAGAAEREKVIVLEVVPGDESTRRTAKLVEEQMLTELAASGRFDVIGQSELVAALGLERQRQLLGCAENGSSCLAELGGALGAQWLVMGTLGRFGSKLRIDVKLVQSGTGKAVARQGRVLDSDDQLFPAITELLAELLQAHRGQTPAPEGSKRPVAPYVLLAAGVAGSAGGGLLMGLASSWGRQLNDGRTGIEYDDAAGRMRLFQVLYVTGAVVGVLGLLSVVWGVVQLVRGPGPKAVDVTVGSGGTLQVMF